MVFVGRSHRGSNYSGNVGTLTTNPTYYMKRTKLKNNESATTKNAKADFILLGLDVRVEPDRTGRESLGRTDDRARGRRDRRHVRPRKRSRSGPDRRQAAVIARP